MKKVIVIPARLDSSRLPKKVLLDLKGKTIIQRVYEQCKKVNNIDAIYIATDSQEINRACNGFTNNVILTKTTHKSGTDRIGEAVAQIDCDIVINVQGDEPFVSIDSISKRKTDLKLSFGNSFASQFLCQKSFREAKYDAKCVFLHIPILK